jgi:hypothetical protein
MEPKPEHETTALTVAQEITPGIWQMLRDIGAAFANSQKMGIHTAEEGAVRALFCLENQLPLTAARGLYFVNGRLGIESSVIASLIRRHDDYDYHIKSLDNKGCTVEILRFNEVIGEATFNEEHAKRAGLLGKDNWKKYAEDMYFAKAITRAQRRFAPDVFMAPVYSSEGMDDWEVIDVDPLPPLPQQQPKPPSFDQLIEKFGADACLEAGLFSAESEQGIWEAADKLAIQAASEKSKNE